MIQIVEDKIFILNGHKITYALFVNKLGFLQNLYFGEKVDNNFLYSLQEEWDKKTPAADDLNKDMYFDTMPSECAFYGRGDYNEPSIIVHRNDGSEMSRFRYVGYEVKKCIPALKSMPCVRGGGESLFVTLKDDFSDIKIVLHYSVFDDFDIVARGCEIINTGNDCVTLRRAFSFCLQFEDIDYSLLRLSGGWARERAPETNKLGHGITKIQSTRGISSHQFNPFIALVKDDCGEETGKCIGFELLYSGSFSLCAEVNGNDKLRVYGGINETNFTWMLHPAESFETPQILISYSNNGIGYLSRQYANFLREKIINPQYVYKERPIVINNWEATYFNFDEKKICEIIEAASKLNIDTFVLDDGWFGNRNTDTTGLGDWFVNETKLKGGLNTIIQKCNECGMKFGLWFEPEMVSEDSNLYRAHPEFAVGKIGVEPARSRTQLVLDFTKQEVVDYVFNAVSDILKSYQIAYVKWDMNRSLSEFYSTGLEVTRQGEFSHRYVLGVYSLAERLMSAFPDIFFEGCAGGGGRFDAGMLYYFSQIWTSDNTDAIDRCKIQWGTSYAYPISAMSCHVSVCPNHQTNRTTPFSTRGAIASLGATGYELDATKLTDEEKNAVIVQIDNYKRIRDLIVHGDLYRIRNPFSGSEFCEIVVSKDKKSTYGVYLALEDSSETQVCLSGLDQKYVYRDIKTGVDYSGKLLMEEGIDIPSLKKYETYVFELKVL